MAIKSLKYKIQHEAYHIVFLQLIVILCLAIIVLLTHGINSGLSVLAGGLAYGLPNLVFVWRVFRYSRTNEVAQFMTAFFLGEAIKLTLSAILFVLIVKYLAVSLLSVLVGFIGAIVAFWVACIWHFSAQNKL